jgi:hypothetical protein
VSRQQIACQLSAVSKTCFATIECTFAGFAGRVGNLKSFGRGESMKRAAMVIAVLGMCAWSFGQSNTKPATQNPPAGQAAQPAGQAAAPAGKRPPAAKTQPEFEAYKAAVAQTDPATLEKSADDFAAKFPDSELLPAGQQCRQDDRHGQEGSGD